MRKIIHHIKKIRHQPEEVRAHILHFSTFIFAVILAMFWFYSLGNDPTEPNVVEEKVESGLQPFSILKDSLIDGYESISDDN